MNEDEKAGSLQMEMGKRDSLRLVEISLRKGPMECPGLRDQSRKLLPR